MALNQDRLAALREYLVAETSAFNIPATADAAQTCMSTAPLPGESCLVFPKSGMHPSAYLFEQVLALCRLPLQTLRQDDSQLVRCIGTQGAFDDCSVRANGARGVDMVPLQ